MIDGGVRPYDEVDIDAEGGAEGEEDDGLGSVTAGEVNMTVSGPGMDGADGAAGSGGGLAKTLLDGGGGGGSVVSQLSGSHLPLGVDGTGSLASGVSRRPKGTRLREVASMLIAFAKFLQDGDTHCLAVADRRDWTESVVELLEDDHLRTIARGEDRPEDVDPLAAGVTHEEMQEKAIRYKILLLLQVLLLPVLSALLHAISATTTTHNT